MKRLADLKTTDRVLGFRNAALNAEKSFSNELFLLADESYEQTKNETMVLRRAKAFACQLHSMTLSFDIGEILIGRRVEKIGAKPVVDEEFEASREPNLWDGLGDMIEYHWLKENFDREISDRYKSAIDDGLIVYPTGYNTGYGHVLPDYESMVKNGLINLISQIDQSLDKQTREDEKDFLKAAKISCLAVLDLSNRYGNYLARLAYSEQDITKRKELESLSAICFKVPGYPAETFHEALQSLWFTHLCINIEQVCNSLSIARPDQYLWPFLENDMNEFRVSNEQCNELMDAFIVKMAENAVSPRDTLAFQQITIGGQTADGKDAVNPVSHMILESIARIRCCQPLLAVRWHPAIDRKFFSKCCECLTLGISLPAIYSDIAYIDILTNRFPIQVQDARNYGIIGCDETGIPGKISGATLGGPLNIAKVLEITINDGKSMTTGKQIGIHSGYLSDFKTMEDLWASFNKQIEFVFTLIREGAELTYRLQKKYFGYPLTSVLFDGAIERARDYNDGALYDMDTINIIGTTNAADSIAMIKKYVFDQKMFSAEGVLNALRQNFAGNEKIRNIFREDAEHFGSGSKRTVSIYNQVCETYSLIFSQHRNPRGGTYAGGTWPVMFPTTLGKLTGADAGGRSSGEPLADSVGPIQGLSKSVPTTIAGDVARLLSSRHWPGGYLFNLWIQTSLFKTAEDLEKMSAFIEAYFLMGGLQIQFNTIDKDTLIDAKTYPEKHRDLIVRVSGFSAYFCSLSESEQNEVISRSSFSV